MVLRIWLSKLKQQQTGIQNEHYLVSYFAKASFSNDL